MGTKDIVSKNVLKELAVDIANLLLQLNVEQEGADVLETEHQRFEVRRADVVVRMRDKQTREPFIFHLEVQNTNDSDMPVRMMRYFTDIYITYPNEPVRQFLVYIGKRRLAMPDHLESPDFTYRYGLLDMHMVDCQSLMALDKPEALVLAILCDFKQRPSQDVVNSILIRLEQLVGDDEAKFRNYYQMLETLAVNRDLLNELHEAKTMLSEIDVNKLPSFQWGKEEGREEEKEGIARNLITQTQMSDEAIATATGLAAEQVETLRKEGIH